MAVAHQEDGARAGAVEVPLDALAPELSIHIDHANLIGVAPLIHHAPIDGHCFRQRQAQGDSIAN